jgi:hypothetical protein
VFTMSMSSADTKGENAICLATEIAKSVNRGILLAAAPKIVTRIVSTMEIESRTQDQVRAMDSSSRRIHRGARHD